MGLVQPSQMHRQDVAPSPCIPLAFMAVHWDTVAIHTRYRMPIVRVDTSRPERMPVARRQPCLNRDSGPSVPLR